MIYLTTKVPHGVAQPGGNALQQALLISVITDLIKIIKFPKNVNMNLILREIKIY